MTTRDQDECIGTLRELCLTSLFPEKGVHDTIVAPSIFCIEDLKKLLHPSEHFQHFTVFAPIVYRHRSVWYLVLANYDPDDGGYEITVIKNFLTENKINLKTEFTWIFMAMDVGRFINDILAQISEIRERCDFPYYIFVSHTEDFYGIIAALDPPMEVVR